MEKKLDEENIFYDILGLSWWADLETSFIEEIIKKDSTSLKNLINFLPKLSLINPDLIYSNTIVSPWGVIAANFLNKPHIWYVREYGDLDHNLKFISSFKKAKITDLFIITTSLWTLFFSRIFLLALVDVSSFPGINQLYMAPAFPIMCLASSLSIYLLLYNRKNNDSNR